MIEFANFMDPLAVIFGSGAIIGSVVGGACALAFGGNKNAEEDFYAKAAEWTKRDHEYKQEAEEVWRELLAMDYAEAMACFQSRLFRLHLESGGSVREIAERLDIDSSHLYRKMRALGIDYKRSAK